MRLDFCADCGSVITTHGWGGRCAPCAESRAREAERPRVRIAGEGATVEFAICEDDGEPD